MSQNSVYPLKNKTINQQNKNQFVSLCSLRHLNCFQGSRRSTDCVSLQVKSTCLTAWKWGSELPPNSYECRLMLQVFELNVARWIALNQCLTCCFMFCPSLCPKRHIWSGGGVWGEGTCSLIKPYIFFCCCLFIGLFIFLSNVCHFTNVWPTALKLGSVTNFDMLFLLMGFNCLVDEIKFMLISG